jgi:hypothetical protein
MTDERSSPEAEWTQLIRRSFDIPDAISEENAKLTIQGWIGVALSASELSDQERHTTSIELFEAIVRLGARGDLDIHLLPYDLRDNLKRVADGRFDEPVADVVVNEAFKSPLGDREQPRQAIRTAAQLIVARIAEHAIKYPFGINGPVTSKPN